MKNVVFVDIYGILTSFSGKKHNNHCLFDDESLDVLKDICLSTNSSLVVIDDPELGFSTNCPNSRYSIELTDKLGIRGVNISGCTTPLKRRNKGFEILNYIEGYGVENFIVLDDDFFEEYPSEIKDHVVNIPFREGLIKSDVDKCYHTFFQSNNLTGPILQKTGKN